MCFGIAYPYIPYGRIANPTEQGGEFSLYSKETTHGAAHRQKQSGTSFETLCRFFFAVKLSDSTCYICCTVAMVQLHRRDNAIASTRLCKQLCLSSLVLHLPKSDDFQLLVSGK